MTSSTQASREKAPEPPVRVLVYLDVPNLLRPLRKRGIERVNFKALMARASELGRVAIAKAFLSIGWEDSPSCGNEGVARALEAAGFEVVYVPLSSAKESRVDLALSAELLDDCHRDRPDIVVLISGDSDFFFVLSKLRRDGIDVEVIALSDCMGASLKAVARQTSWYEQLAKPMDACPEAKE